MNRQSRTEVVVDYLAVVLVLALVLGAVLTIAFVVFLAVWWQPDCHQLLEQGKECRDWPWEEVR